MKVDPSTLSQTLYIPIASPPTPSPSPTPFSLVPALDVTHTTAERRRFLAAVLRSCTPAELLFVSETLAPLLKRDFLSALPPELGLHILNFLDDPRTLVRTSVVSRSWRNIATSEVIWRSMCKEWSFGVVDGSVVREDVEEVPLEDKEPFPDLSVDAVPDLLEVRGRGALQSLSKSPPDQPAISDSIRHTLSYRTYFKDCYIKIIHWQRGGRLLRSHRLPMLSASVPQHALIPPLNLGSQVPGAPPLASTPSPSPLQQPDAGVVTCLAMDSEWVVVGLASSRIHVFSARTGVLARTLVGHDSGVWGLCLISASRPGKGKASSRPGKATASPTKNVFSEKNGYDGSLSNDFRDLLLDDKEERAGVKPVSDPESLATIPGQYATLSPALKLAVGLDENEDDSGGIGVRGIVDEDATEHHEKEHQARRYSADASASSSSIGLPVGHMADHNANHFAGEQSTDNVHPDASPKLRHYKPECQSDPCFASEGWGQPNALVISGGCDKDVRVWDVKSGYCIYVLPGHTSTIRCMRTLHGRPLAVTGSRDGTVRTWDIQRGRMVRVLEGHSHSVRCLDVNGNRAVSGSYDTTCRIWDLDTGECLHVLQGHFQELYTVAFDGVLVATGSLDTTVRVWDAQTGKCLALLQGHTALVCQLQLSRKHQLLATGGSDGRIVTFSLGSPDGSYPGTVGVAQTDHALSNDDRSGSSGRKSRYKPPRLSSRLPSYHNSPDAATSTNKAPLPRRRAAYEPLHRMAAHMSSVTSLQFDGRFLITSGSDGCVYLWETQTGRFVRKLTDDGDCVWKVGFTSARRLADMDEDRTSGEGVGDVCVIVGKRGRKTVLEVWGFGKQ